jgi:LuxR family maltose regulon positive regulatory protein
VPPIAVPRPRLEQLLDAHPDRRVVLVHGPAGAGKTVVVAQWLGRRRLPCAWLTVDETHDAPGRLARHIVDLAQETLAGAAPRPPPDGRDEPEDAAVWDLLATAARRDVGPLVIVLDGVDRLQGATGRRLVGRLVDQPPPGTRLVLLGRAKPRLGLERARLREDLLEVGPLDLRFRREEIEELTATWVDRVVDVAHLEQSTLGWAAGLRLAQLDMAATDAEWLPSPSPVEDGVAGQYVREELVDASPDHLRRFLEVTCWLPVLTSPLCAAVVRATGPSPALSPSDLQALPLVPVASRPGAVRYPPVLAEALRRELGRRDAEATAQAMCAAAAAAHRCGELMTAIELFLEAGRSDEATGACIDLAAAGESSLRRLDELFGRRPELVPHSEAWVPWRARAAVAAGRVEEAEGLLRRCDGRAGADAEGETDAQTETDADADPMDDSAFVVARATVAEHMGDIAGLLACAARLSEPTAHLPGPGPRPSLLARCWRVRALVWSGEMARARAELHALEAAWATRRRAAVPVGLARAWVAWADGDVAVAADAVAAIAELDQGEHAAELALLGGATDREANRLARAAHRLEEALGSPNRVVAALAASELGRCHRTAGATMKALELVVSTRSSLAPLPPAVEVHLRATEARLRLDRGDLAGAHAVVRAAPPGVDAQLLAARVALRQAPDRAGELLGVVVPVTVRHAVDRMLLRAQLPGSSSAEASVVLVKAVCEGEPRGLVRTFLDEGPALCRQFPEMAVESRDRSLGRIAALACQELAHAPSASVAPPAEQLTVRELAVLRMLPLRLSNREMATQLYISVNTLKTHVRAIYRKLDVPHRSGAVRRARALELL